MASRERRLRRELQALLDQYEADTVEAFMASVDDMLDRIVVQDLVRELERGNVEQALFLLAIVVAAFRPLEVALRNAFERSGGVYAGLFPRVRRPDGSVAIVRFDARNPTAAQIAERVAGRFITRITEDQRQAVRSVIVDGLQRGRSPNDIALALVGRVNRATGRREGGIIGLAGTQAQWLQTAREELLSGNRAQMRNYLKRELRDRRFDPLVIAAMEAGRALSAADVNNMTRHYANRLLRYRGETIAKTEVGYAVMAARHEAFRQGLIQSDLPEDSIRRIWVSSRDEKVRVNHAEMEGQTVIGLRDPFIDPEGNQMMHPLDQSLGADISTLANCRCVERIEIDTSGRGFRDG